ncbi:MAG: UDP-galactopyranose mutase [Paludibacteraceae bacterium]|nr:UDP-galactopyranose mutase [Paludibacteraceae bacterium]
MSFYDYLIVGSGLYGATFAYRAKLLGKRVLVIDKRSQLGGNLYCQTIDGKSGQIKHNDDYVECPIHIHQYGPHIFHTSNVSVWNFVNSIVPFNRFINCPIANYKGELYNLPFNMNTFNRIWPDVLTPIQATTRIEEQKALALNALNEKAPQNLEEQALSLVGKDIYEKLIKEYTEKQWGRQCKDLPPSIINRLPVRMVYDNNYFNDCYQGIPEGGYNKLIDGLLKDVDSMTNCDFFRDGLKFENNYCKLDPTSCLKDTWRTIADKLVYTGPIDQYFDYSLGKLEWRSVVFKTRVEDTPNYQGSAVVNYTSHEVPYTRVIEHKHFEMFGQDVYDCPKTVVSEEYPVEYKEGMEPYYPVNDVRNDEMAEAYHRLAFREANRVIFGGRLAQYQYLDMAPIIEQVFALEDI